MVLSEPARASFLSTMIVQFVAKAAITPKAASQGARTTPITPTVAGISSNPTSIQRNTYSFLEQIPKIQALALQMKRNGKSDNTVNHIVKDLKLLAQRSNLDEPENVKDAISKYIKKNKRPASNNYKGKLCDSYASYIRFNNLTWTRPKYTKEYKAIQPPTKERIDLLIASAHNPLSLKIHILAETGLRPIEVQGEKGLLVKDIHFDTKTITARITKGCNPRPPIPITETLCERLRAYIKKHELQPDDIIFNSKVDYLTNHFIRFKHTLAKRLKDPTILSIRLYDLRHAYATRQLHKTQNAEIVRIKMGHKTLNTTQRYLHLLAGQNGEWLVEGTTNKERAKQLLEADFTYQLTTPDGTMIFRKPK